VLLGEALNAGDERLGHRVPESGRGQGVPARGAEEGCDLAFAWQPGLVDVEVRAVDAFDREGQVPTQDFGNSAWYTHGWFGSSRVPGGLIYRFAVQLGLLKHTPQRHDRSLLYILSV
jgi:hypothetical protein